MKIAIICFDNPFLKPFEGGKRGMKSRIDSLLLIDDVCIDVYVMNKRNEGFSDWEPSKDSKIRLFQQYQMNRANPFYLFSSYPVCVNKRFVKECSKRLSNMEYDFVIYEGLQVSKYRFKGIVKSRHHILYFHDIESDYRSQVAKASSGLRKIANVIESIKFKILEKKSNYYFDRFWFVSSHEKDVFSSRYNNEKCVYIPYPVDSLKLSEFHPITKNSLLYIGDLSLQNNKQSLEWFINECLPSIREEKSDIEVSVAGKMDESFRDWLLKKGVSPLGYVDDLDALYESTNIILCPVLYGAGVKIKTLDALSRRKLVITTAKGIEGTELKDNLHLIVKDDPQEYAAACVSALTDISKFISVIRHGFEYVSSVHTSSNQAKIMSEEFGNYLGDNHDNNKNTI